MMSNKRLEMRSGFTLIEVLLAVTLGLILMLGVVQMFAMVGNFVTGSQGLMELDQKVRSAQIMLQNDLVRYTARMTVPSDLNSADGYFRIDENSVAALCPDTRLSNFYSNLSGIQGDYNDVLTFTIHDLDSPFIGRNGTTVVHSPDAEVKWFVYHDTTSNVLKLYRRINVLNPTGNPPLNPQPVENNNIKNASLSDLTISQGGKSGGRGAITYDDSYRDKANDSLANAELILDNIIIFDVKVWDPEAPNPTQSNANNKGKYVDLGQGTTFSSARGAIFDTGSQFKYAPTNLTTVSETGADTNKVVNAPDPTKFSIPTVNNKSMAGITLQGIQILVRTFDPTSGIIRDFTIEQEFVTH